MFDSSRTSVMCRNTHCRRAMLLLLLLLLLVFPCPSFIPSGYKDTMAGIAQEVRKLVSGRAYALHSTQVGMCGESEVFREEHRDRRKNIQDSDEVQKYHATLNRSD